MTLRDKTLFITGASRGIGKAIALRAARDGANVVIAAKTAEPHPSLPGTIYTAAAEIEAAGGRALPCIVDVRDEESVQAAIDSAVEAFGGIDILVNNASAIMLTGTLQTPMKRYDLMHHVNTRGTFLCTKLCIPHLLRSASPHVLNLSPPLNMDPRWFGGHVAYTMAKYGMSMCVLGHAEEFKGKIAVNALWPRTAIATAAVKNLLGGDQAMAMSRKPEIMADAAWHILTRDVSCTGNFFIDDAVLTGAGVTDLDQYAVTPGSPLMPDFFL
jgi:citronellol/citronellal dehydrogenase